MFKSKGFTIAFIFLTILIIGLSSVLLYLIFGDTEEALSELTILQQQLSAAQQTEQPTYEQVPVVTETLYVPDDPDTVAGSERVPAETEGVKVPARALNASDPHTYPVFDEDISEAGSFEIIKPGQTGDGIIFHALPLIDEENAKDNWVNYSGTYPVSGKRFILNNGSAVMLLKTGEGFYVAFDGTLLKYDRETPDTASAVRTGTYGGDATDPAVMSVLLDDGMDLVIEIEDLDNGVQRSYIAYTVAHYGAGNEAAFEYIGTDGSVHAGKLVFEGTDSVTVSFETPVPFAKGDYTGFGLSRKN